MSLQQDHSSSEMQRLFEEALRQHQAGRLSDAEQLYKKILSHDPRHADSLHLLGLIVYQRGQLDNAAGLMRQAIESRGNVPTYHGNLGNVLKAQGKVDEAALCYKRALALHPHAESHYNLATVFQDQGRFDEAVTHYRQAIALNPDLAPAHNNLGNILKDQGMFDEAKACFQRAIACAPNLAEAYYNLGTLFKDQNKFDEAKDQFNHALVLKPDYVDAYNNLGAILNNTGDISGALTQFNSAIAYKTDHVEAHVNKAMVLLVSGNFAEGWKEYEWRLRMTDLARHRPDAPLWDGCDLQGKSILLICEQGFGDSIQFIRYAAKVKERGARVLLCCPQSLARLFTSAAGIDQIFPDGAVLPAYDYYAPLMSLPRLFDTRLDTVPNATPYLSAPADRVAVWSGYLQPYTGLKVGLVWAGNSRFKNPDAHAADLRRSMRLDQLAPLAGIANVQYFSLQKGPAAEQIKTAPPGLAVTDFMDRAEDFADTAAFIATLDLVIGVDTSVIHLAAALGKPVWVLSRFDGCWRWLRDREDSPWYPSLRLFKQTVTGDWQPVIERVAAALNIGI